MSMDHDTIVEEFEWDIPESYTVTSTIDDHAEAFGNRVAVRFLDEDDRREERTYADLRDDMRLRALRLCRGQPSQRYDLSRRITKDGVCISA